ncbi:MAG: PAC2 family protein [Actinomycetes bacterium]|jgi:proteasome assembly chaperone (PAC2) family protein
MIEFEGQRDSLPELVNPVMICAFEGWNDAGDAASGAVLHLEEVWAARQVGEFDPEDYYDFQVSRPEVSIDDNVRSITWPTTRLSIAHLAQANRDVILVHGIEPSMRWRSFTAELINVARELGVEMVITLGSLLADTPHTRAVPVSGTSTSSTISDRFGYEPSLYEGPTGIVGVIQDACASAGMASVSLWAAVPHYVGAPPCPKATLALLARVEDLLDLPVPLEDLPDESRAWQIGVDELASEDDEIAAYVRQLEELVDTAELPEATGDAIAREFERYLRRRGAEPPK